MELPRSLFSLLRISKQIGVSITKLGPTSSTSMLSWSIVYHGMTDLIDQIRGTGTHLWPQQGKEATPLKRDLSRLRYLSPMTRHAPSKKKGASAARFEERRASSIKMFAECVLRTMGGHLVAIECPPFSCRSHCISMSHVACCTSLAQSSLQRRECADVFGFIKSPQTDGEWQICGHGAFQINRDVLGIRPADQSFHREGWIHFTRRRSTGRPSPYTRLGLAPSKTCDKARKEAAFMNTCDHSLVQKREHSRRGQFAADILLLRQEQTDQIKRTVDVLAEHHSRKISWNDV